MLLKNEADRTGANTERNEIRKKALDNVRRGSKSSTTNTPNAMNMTIIPLPGTGWEVEHFISSIRGDTKVEDSQIDDVAEHTS